MDYAHNVAALEALRFCHCGGSAQHRRRHRSGDRRDEDARAHRTAGRSESSMRSSSARTKIAAAGHRGEMAAAPCGKQPLDGGLPAIESTP